MLIWVGDDLYGLWEVGELRGGRYTGETLEEAATMATARGSGAFGGGRNHVGSYVPNDPAVRGGSAGTLLVGKQENKSRSE